MGKNVGKYFEARKKEGSDWTQKWAFHCQGKKGEKGRRTLRLSKKGESGKLFNCGETRKNAAGRGSHSLKGKGKGGWRG